MFSHSLVSLYSFGDFASTGKSPLLNALIDVEAAANAAAIQLMSFKDTLDNDSEVCALLKSDIFS